MEAIKGITKGLFVVFTILAIAGFFLRDNYKNINDIAPEVLEEPKQTETSDKETITFSDGGYEYEVTPLYDYDISGLVVSAIDYSWLKFYRRDSIFPVDLCVIWGGNAASKVYQEEKLRISQDARFCYLRYAGKEIEINQNEISNNHLVINGAALKKSVKNILPGDQIKIKGKLVDVVAQGEKENLGEYDPEKFVWKTSVSREDSGAGACETIYVEEVEILRRGNPEYRLMFRISKYGMLFVVALHLLAPLLPKNKARWEA